jgi:hypothetical protein
LQAKMPRIMNSSYEPHQTLHKQQLAP